jgi:hypothetical protein
VALRAGNKVWLATTGPDPAVARLVDDEEAASADGEVTGTSMQLYRWLWGRIPDRDLPPPTGDHDAIAQLWALLRLATK